jgi:hypothetical protein
MAATKTYNRIIRKMVVAFGKLFDDITLVRYNPNLTEAERFIVPIVYATKELYVRRLEDDPVLNKKVQTTLPRMSFEMNGLSYDTTRKLNTNIKQFARQADTSVISQYNPVPYNFDFNLYIYVRNIEDGTQILEHIMPFFAPDYTLKLNLIPEMGIIKEVPIVMNSATSEIEYEGDKNSETRMIIWTLNFTVKGYIFGNISNTGLIKTSITNIFSNISESDTFKFNMTTPGLGTYQAGEIVYQGYSAPMATATAKVLLWENNVLHLTNINGNFVSSQPIIGVVSNSNYVFDSYQVAPKQLVKIYTTPSPTDANANTAYAYTTDIMEEPNIVNGLVVPSNFAGDAMLQIGTDDLQSLQENRTDLN